MSWLKTLSPADFLMFLGDTFENKNLVKRTLRKNAHDIG